MSNIFTNGLFDDFFDDAWFNRDMRKAEKKLYGHRGKNIMNTDIKEHDEGYELYMDLPGFTKDEVKVSLENGYLTVEAAKGLDEDKEDKKNSKYICRGKDMPAIAEKLLCRRCLNSGMQRWSGRILQ